MNQPITESTATSAAQTLAIIREIESRQVHTSDDDAQLAASRAILNGFLSEHASELLGTWFVMYHEYTPIVKGMAMVLKRANALISESNKALRDDLKG
jgi:hypothetical protein